jgi:NAD(P)H-hydrate epimerase
MRFIETGINNSMSSEQFSSSTLPVQLYRADQVRELDRVAIEEAGIPGITLMRRAGEATFSRLMQQWPLTRAISIWCGSGNNGGDGYVIAGLARQRGLAVQLVQLSDEVRLRGDAKTACDWARQQGVNFTPYHKAIEVNGDICVDALLGTGLKGGVRGPVKTAIELLNRQKKPIVAVDIPSGLCSDTGNRLGVAIDASLTVTFIGLKQGLFTAAGPACVGELIFDDLAVPARVFDKLVPSAELVSPGLVDSILSPRPRDAHKGDNGHVMVVGGNLGMGGAALMAAQAAGRIGAGLVSLATRPEYLSAAVVRCPEVMAHGVRSGQDLESVLDRADVTVVGPGLGKNAWSEQMLRAVLASDAKLVIDADALNLISGGRFRIPDNYMRVITPHPGEAARLLGCSTSDVQKDRFDAVRQLQQRYGGVAILKGSGTLICHNAESPISVCTGGNPGMGSGGMGDVLSGVIGGLLAQGLSLSDAACLGVSVHASAADRAAMAGERGLLATDLLPHVRRLVNPRQKLKRI